MSKNTRVVQKTLQCDLGNHQLAEVMPIGDLHFGDATVNKHLVKSVIRWVNARDNRYVVIAGDIFDAALSSSVSDTYKAACDMDGATEQFVQFCKDMGGNKKILAVVRGNHDNRVNKAVGLDPVRWACELADINYCGAEAFISFGVGDWNYDREKNRSSIKYLMFMTHGVGGGRGVGGKVNALMRHNNIIAADLFVQGHTHTPTVVPNTVYVADNRHENIIEKDQMYITTCGFIGRDGYAKDFCYNPVSQKFPVIRLGGHRRKIEAEILDFG